jgi:hypothetical protein
MVKQVQHKNTAMQKYGHDATTCLQRKAMLLHFIDYQVPQPQISKMWGPSRCAKIPWTAFQIRVWGPINLHGSWWLQNFHKYHEVTLQLQRSCLTRCLPYSGNTTTYFHLISPMSPIFKYDNMASTIYFIFIQFFLTYNLTGTKSMKLLSPKQPFRRQWCVSGLELFAKKEHPVLPANWRG